MQIYINCQLELTVYQPMKSNCMNISINRPFWDKLPDQSFGKSLDNFYRSTGVMQVKL